jgi:hypothetical protein
MILSKFKIFFVGSKEGETEPFTVSLLKKMMYQKFFAVVQNPEQIHYLFEHVKNSRLK